MTENFAKVFGWWKTNKTNEITHRLNEAWGIRTFHNSLIVEHTVGLIAIHHMSKNFNQHVIQSLNIYRYVATIDVA